MLIELIMTPVFVLLRFVLELLPSMAQDASFDISGVAQFLEGAFVIFPFDLFCMCISNVVFWLEAQLAWAIIEWVYRKIPGVS